MKDIQQTAKARKVNNRTFVALAVFILVGALCFGCTNSSQSNQSSSDSQQASTSQEASGGQQASASDQQMPAGAISWQEASQHVGETVTVYGQVADTNYESEVEGQRTYIDLGVAYPDSSRTTMIIDGKDREAFPEPPEAMYSGKTLCVTGEVYQHESVCYIKVSSPSQVQVLD